MTPDPIWAGDSALLLQVGSAIDPAVNARAIGVAHTVRERGIPGVRDVVSTFCSVAVFFDPLTTDVAAVAAALHGAAQETPLPAMGSIVDVPVVYGGDEGPDLEDVARFAGCSGDAVIERHSARDYRVFMLGFLPGFPYMATVDPSIAAPRRVTPRVRVAAGSVGIAGAQTGIYPRESPGGWQIIGRTALGLFDPARTLPATFAPGDRVRFVPTSGAVSSGFSGTVSDRSGANPVGFAQAGVATPARHASHDFDRVVTVLRPGFFTTIQDSGRWGCQTLGVPVAGPMDYAAHRVANALVGNTPDAATLEITGTGPELRFESAARIGVAGAELQVTIDGVPLPPNASATAPAGAIMRCGERRGGARAYVAADGGIAVPTVLRSRATHVVSGMGGISGRPLKAGDRLPLPPASAGVSRGPIAPRGPLPHVEAVSRGGARVRVVTGPQANRFDAAAIDLLQRGRYTISPQSDRMGYRLRGPALPAPHGGEMISDVTFTGGLQIPSSGDPILLMADRQTTGGYPQIAVVITADLPVAGQLGPGDWLEFEVCTRAQAVAALIAREGTLLAAGA
jgi:KipI family sensor histidine kinase inhibitor